MRKLPIILLTVLAWVVGANATSYTIVAEADTAIADNKLLTVTQWASLLSAGDDLTFTVDYAAGTEFVSLSSKDNLTIDIGGFTVTTTTQASNAWIQFTSCDGVTVKNGTIADAERTYGIFYIANSDDGTYEDLVLSSDAAHCIYMSGTSEGNAFTDCTFETSSSKIGISSAATGASNTVTGCAFSQSSVGVQFQNGVTPSITSCTADSCTTGFYFLTCTTPTITSCTVSGSGTYGIRDAGSSNFAATSCTIGGATSGLYMTTTNLPVITSCTFTGCATTGLYNASADSVTIADCVFDSTATTSVLFAAAGTGVHTITGCTFTNCGEYGIKWEDENITMEDCSFGEQYYHSMHGIMYGNDNGSQLETDLSGVVTNCDFAFSVVGDSLTMNNFHYFVVKADSLRAHGNIFRTVRAATNNNATTTGTCFFLKGCNDVMLYNNTMDIDGFTGVKYRVQPDPSPTYTDSTNVVFNNTFGSTLDYAMYCWTKAAKDSLFQTSNGNLYNNQYLCQVGYNGAEDVDMMNSDSIWYNAQSFTTEGDWHYYLGGSTDAGALYRYDSRFEPTYVGAPNDARKTRYGFDQVLYVGIGQPWPTPKYAWSCWDDTLGNAGTRLPLFELIPYGASASQLLSIELNHNLFMAEADSALVDSVWIQGTVLDKSEIYPANDAPR